MRLKYNFVTGLEIGVDIWFISVDIQSRPFQMSRFERGNQRNFINSSAARSVDEETAGTHGGEFASGDEVGCLGCGGNVDGDDIRGGEKRVHGRSIDGRAFSFNGRGEAFAVVVYDI